LLNPAEVGTESE